MGRTGWTLKILKKFSLVGALIGATSSIALGLNESSQTFTIDGQLFQAGTTNTLRDGSVKLTIQILNPTATCLLYEEEQTISTATSDGHFTVYVGSTTGASKRTVNDPGRTMAQIFQNSVPISANNVPGQTCTGGAYTPLAGAIRYFRLTVTPSSTGIPNTLSPDIVMDSVPQALVAQSLQGIERSQILQVNNSGSTTLTQSNLEALFTTPAYTNLQSILAGNFLKTDSSGAVLPSYASNPSSPSNGEIWFDTTTNQIKYQTSGGIQTLTASSVSGGLTEADIPTLTTPGKVSGSTITSGTISGTAAVNTSGNLITTGTVSGLTVQATNLRVYSGANYVQMTAGSISGNVNFTLPTGAGASGQVLSTDGTGTMSWITPLTTSASGTTNAIPKFTAAGAIGNSALSDNGTVITATRAVVETTNPIATGASVNLASSNTHTLASVGGSTITITNQQDGGMYTIVVEDTTSRTYTFSGCTTSYFKPANAATTGSTRTVYGLLTVKKGANWDCYITWSSGFQ